MPDRFGQWVVCPHCQGSGYGDNLGDVTELVHEDQDFAEDYAAGVYNTGCRRCNGERVVPRCVKGDCSEAAVEGTWYPTEDGEAVRFHECFDHLAGEAREQYESEQELLAMEAAERRVGA